MGLKLLKNVQHCYVSWASAFSHVHSQCCRHTCSVLGRAQFCGAKQTSVAGCVSETTCAVLWASVCTSETILRAIWKITYGELGIVFHRKNTLVLPRPSLGCWRDVSTAQALTRNRRGTGGSCRSCWWSGADCSLAVCWCCAGCWMLHFWPKLWATGFQL